MVWGENEPEPSLMQLDIKYLKRDKKQDQELFLLNPTLSTWRKVRLKKKKKIFFKYGVNFGQRLRPSMSTGKDYYYLLIFF